MGYPNVSGIFSLGLTAEKYMELGKKEIEEYVLALRGYLQQRVKQVSGLSLQYDFSGENCSQIVRLIFDYDGGDFDRFLFAERVFLNTEKTKHGRSLRLGLHYYNDESDIDRFIEVIKKYERAG